MKFIHKTLQNNQKVLFIDKRSLPTVTLKYIVRAGSVDEVERKRGTSMLTHRMNLRGPKTYSDTHNFNTAIELFGAEISSESDKEFTSISLNAELVFLPELIEILADILYNPRDQMDDLEKEKQTLLAQINEIEDDPHEYIVTKFFEQIHKGTKLKYHSYGSLEDIPSIELTDIKKFREKYISSQSLIVICGNFSGQGIQSAISLLDKSFNSKLSKPTPIKINQKVSPQTSQFIRRKINQPVFVLGTYAPSYSSSDYYTYLIARTILGVGFGGKMISIIREQMNLAYYAYSFYNPNSFYGTGGVVAGVHNDKLEDAIISSRQIIKDLCEGKLTSTDVARAKGLYIGALISSIESSESIATFYGNQLMRRGKLVTFEQIKKELDKITKSDISRIFQQYFQRQLYIAVIGNKNIEKL